MIEQEDLSLSCVRGGLDGKLRKISSLKGLSSPGNGQSREVVNSPSLGIFKGCVVVAFWSMVNGGLGRAGLMIELDDFKGLFHSK